MSDLEFEKVDGMSSTEERAFMRKLSKALANDDGGAAESHLKAGRAICYLDPVIFDGMVRKHPDGRKEVVRLEDDDTYTVLRVL